MNLVVFSLFSFILLTKLFIDFKTFGSDNLILPLLNFLQKILKLPPFISFSSILNISKPLFSKRYFNDFKE